MEVVYTDVSSGSGITLGDRTDLGATYYSDFGCVVMVIKMIKRIRHKLYIINLYIRFLCVCVFSSNTIVHVGFPYERKKLTYNIGDPILYTELEEMFDFISKQRYSWAHLPIGVKINRMLIIIINKFTKCIIIGGHGLMMSDCGYKNSGWLFNIGLSDLRKVKVPMVFFAIGYNPFRRQTDFPAIFNTHIEECIKRAIFFGLRNFGSIECVKRYVSPQYHDRIMFQPCPTTMLSLYEKTPSVEQRNEIGICLAFDRFKYRFEISFDDIIAQLMSYKHYCESIGYKTVFFVHTGDDLEHERCKEFVERGIKVIPLVGKSIDEVFEFYKSKKLIVGMRGHSLMIPFGLRIPCISLTNQDKQKFFMEIIDHLDRSIEIDSKDFYSDLIKQTDCILKNYATVIDEITNKQKEFYAITTNNMTLILKNIQPR